MAHQHTHHRHGGLHEKQSLTSRNAGESKHGSNHGLLQNKNTMLDVKQAITENDWREYMKAKNAFYDCLKAHDWSHIPKLQSLKQSLQK